MTLVSTYLPLKTYKKYQIFSDPRFKYETAFFTSCSLAFYAIGPNMYLLKLLDSMKMILLCFLDTIASCQQAGLKITGKQASS